MPTVDPNDPKYASQKRYNPRAGWAVVQVVGLYGDETNSKPFWNVGVVVLAEIDNQPDPALDPPSDVGMLARARLYRTEKSLWRLVSLAKTLGQTAPFDTDKLDEVLKVLADKPFEARIVVTEVKGDNNKTRHYADVEEWRPLGQSPDPEWAGTLDHGFDEWEAYLVKRAEAIARGPRPGSRSGGGGRGGGSRSGGGGGSGDRGGDAPRDDIPFRSRGRNRSARIAGL